MKSLKILLITTIIYPIFLATAQDNGDDSESAAEASITGSASQPSVTAPGSIEGNPLVIAVRSGLISLDDALKLGLGAIRDLAAAGGDFEALIKSVNSAGDVDLDLILKLNNLSLDEELLTAALKVAAAYDSSDLKNQEALVAAASVAKGFLTDRTITSTESLDSIASINVGDFTKSGYNIALVEILNKYGAIGQKGNSLLDAEFGSSRSLSTALTAESSTAGYLDLLSTLTGGRSLTETVLGSNPAEVDLSKPTASVIDVPMENVSLAPGANITIGATSSSGPELPVIAGPSTIDVSKYLTKNNDNSVYVIGAAKDMKIVSDVTFKNSNTEEDHALVLGAADDFMISGTESDRIDVTYEGSNLAFGSGGTESDSMYLVNTNITTGGNLAAGTLGTLNITNATINVGNGGANSDPDNIYLYANDLIQINNLDFSNSRLDDVYMEAITVNLNDVDFPSAAQVHLRSRDGNLKFGTYASPTVGAVNLTDVTHGAINGGQVLADTDFTKTSNGYKSSTNLATGHNAFTISSQSRGD